MDKTQIREFLCNRKDCKAHESQVEKIFNWVNSIIQHRDALLEQKVQHRVNWAEMAAANEVIREKFRNIKGIING